LLHTKEKLKKTLLYPLCQGLLRSLHNRSEDYYFTLEDIVSEYILAPVAHLFLNWGEYQKIVKTAVFGQSQT